MAWVVVIFVHQDGSGTWGCDRGRHQEGEQMRQWPSLAVLWRNGYVPGEWKNKGLTFAFLRLLSYAGKKLTSVHWLLKILHSHCPLVGNVFCVTSLNSLGCSWYLCPLSLGSQGWHRTLKSPTTESYRDGGVHWGMPSALSPPALRSPGGRKLSSAWMHERNVPKSSSWPFKQQLPQAGVGRECTCSGEFKRWFVPWVSVVLFPDTFEVVWEKPGLFSSLKEKISFHRPA